MFISVTRFSRNFFRIVNSSCIQWLKFGLVNAFIVTIGFRCFTTLNVSVFSLFPLVKSIHGKCTVHLFTFPILNDWLKEIYNRYRVGCSPVLQVSKEIKYYIIQILIIPHNFRHYTLYRLQIKLSYIQGYTCTVNPM